MRTLFLFALLSSVPLTAEMRLELVRHSLTGAHCRYREYVEGIPSDVYEVRPCDASAFGIAAEAQALRPDASLRIIDGRVARRQIVEERPLERFAYDYDLETGALIRTVPLFFHAKPARVFDPNPVAATNDTTLQDQNDAATAVPEHAYRDVDLLDVVASGPLAGPHVKLVDRQAPSVAPPDAALPLLFDRAADGFEDVNVYFHIDRTQRYLQSLGYTAERSIAAYAIEADAHSANGSDNSFFLPSVTRIAEGTLHFGEGGTDDAEDADLIVHEYGHAIQEWIAPGTFGGAFTSESRALSEGFGDYWAYSAHSAQRLASGRDPFCLADWDARCWEDDASQQCAYRPGSDCLRRVDGTRTMADYERTGGAGVEHRNGSIWSSALREIHQQLGRTITDTIVIEALFDVPPNPTFTVMAQRMLEADRLLFNGTYAQTICAAMLARGIVTGCDETRPRGEQTLFQSSDRVLPIPENNSAGVTSSLTIDDARAIERIYVRVDIAHPLRGDLRIELIAPDGTVVLLQQVSGERGADVRTTFGLTAQPVEPLGTLHGRSAAGVWKLVVRDLRTRDAGTLLSWGLVLQLEGDVPLSERPRGEHAQMIPVVAHLFGVGATHFASDVRIANPATERVTATLIFTRSGEDGRTSFAAMKAILAPGQTLAFDDIVATAFHTAGSGSLEILGDVIVMSRTYAETAGGTLGQQVPPVRDSTALGEAPIAIAPLPEERSRYNIGVTEIGGASGMVMIGARRIELQPFSHVQFPADGTFVTVSVIEGEARVAAYGSQVNEIGDPMFIPAETLRNELVQRAAPAISVDRWRTDVWRSTASSIRIDFDVLWVHFLRRYGVIRVELTANQIGGTRIRSSSGTDQFVPFAGDAPSGEQHLLFIETTPPYRTNIGIFTDLSVDITAEAVVYEASGNEVQREILRTVDGAAQIAVTPQIAGGRAVVRLLDGMGHAYASLVDNRTGDATYVQGR
ncbi:MAG: proprotein convertase P-domain-containing protein [Acidobacteriota bacterium]|nr:proprotein convertase P-domain-containing protein [Acidobacteriota bacterium]